MHKRFVLAVLFLSTTVFLGPRTLAEYLPNAVDVLQPEVTVKQGAALPVTLSIKFDSDFHLNADAPSKIGVWLEEAPNARIDAKIHAADEKLAVPIPAGATHVTLRGSSTVYYCRTENVAVCFLKSFRFTQPITLSDSGAAEVTLAPPTLGNQ